MAGWVRFSPKLSITLPFGVEIGAELPLSEIGFLQGPPISAGRYQRARRFADETIAAIDMDDLQPAIARMLTLAGEFPADARSEAVAVSSEFHTFSEATHLWSPDEKDERSKKLRDRIIEVVTKFLTQADLGEQAAAQLNPPVASTDPDAVGPPGVAPPPSSSGATPAAALEAVSLVTRGKALLSDVTVELQRGSVVGVVGRNGAGKTTLLRLLAQEIRPTSGDVTYPALRERGYSGGPLLDRIAYVPQVPKRYTGGLEDHLRAFAALRGLRGDELSSEIAYTMERFGLGRRPYARWSALSGGLRTRVDLARAMLASPDLLLVDEPLGPLDSQARREYVQYLRDLADSNRKVCVVVTSQDVFAVGEIADHLIVLGVGKLLVSGAPADIELVTNQKTFEFAGDFTEHQLHAAFLSTATRKLTRRGGTWLLVAEPETSTESVLTPLLDTGARLDYFRDLSRSAQPFLEDVQ
jgi:ABC-type multidrug transport system ATPase subunit